MTFENKRIKAAACFCMSLLLAGCAATKNTSDTVPDYITSLDSCILVFGGGGMIFKDKMVDDLWFRINSTVSNSVADDLSTRGYKIEKLIMPAQPSPERGSLIGKAMVAHQCRMLVQISHMKEMGAHEAEFGFDVEILYPSISDSYKTSGGRTYKFLSAYTKKYRYPFSVFEKLSLNGLGREISKEIDDAGVIKKMDAGTAERK